MDTQQTSYRLNISVKLDKLLQSKADSFGVPVTQYIKHLILKDVEDHVYPTFRMTSQTEEKIEEALQDIDQAVDAKTFFKQLNNAS